MTDMPQLDENTKALYEIAQAINRLTLMKAFELRARAIEQGSCTETSEGSSLLLASNYFKYMSVTATTIDDIAADASTAIFRTHKNGKAESGLIFTAEEEAFGD